jgi:hypothetical protein
MLQLYERYMQVASSKNRFTVIGVPFTAEVLSGFRWLKIPE